MPAIPFEPRRSAPLAQAPVMAEQSMTAPTVPQAWPVELPARPAGSGRKTQAQRTGAPKLSLRKFKFSPGRVETLLNLG